MLEQRIQQHFIDSADLKYQAAQTLSHPIAAAVQAVLACVTSGGKVLACGNGPSAAEAQQFARQVRALGQAGDVLLALTVHGNDPNLLAAAEAAHERDMTVVVLAGRTGGKLAAMLRETDVLISVPHDRAARVREVHTLVLHCISDGVDAQLLGEQEIPL